MIPTTEDVKVVLERFGKFIGDTAYDFKQCWSVYPNVLIWCGVAILIAYFV